jgi:CheY-like chemotaxis protein/two-component sensor histidine kinase
MSHELRTPLNGLLNMLKLLQTTDIDGEQVEYIEGAIQSGSRLTRLLSDILDLSRVEAGKLALVAEPFPVADLLSSVRETFGPALRGRSVELSVRRGPEVPDHLDGDEVRIRQVLFNLVGNAMKFTETGRITLTLSAVPRPAPGALTLLATVQDTGVGIPEDKLDAIFASFAQVDSGYAKKYQGAGLGLAIVRRLVELMDGYVMVESAPGAGSVFTASMAVSAASGCRTPLAEPMVPVAPGQAWRILLVEDERINLRSLHYLLGKAGFPVTEAENGREALERLRDGDFDLVLMDVQMPVMDGVEATRCIRQGLAGADRADIPVIALTAYAMPGDRERFLAAGMDAYLSKPADIREILWVICTVMEARAASGQDGAEDAPAQ